MTPYRQPFPAVGDQAFPTFWPSVGSRAAADRFLARWGLPPARWSIRERAVVRVQRNGRAPLTRLERRELRAHLGPDPRMAAAVRFVREHRGRARLLRRRRPELAAIVLAVVTLVAL